MDDQTQTVEPETTLKKPTHMQRRAAEYLVSNGGTVSDAMRHAGYSENTVNDTRKLTQSEGFQTILIEMGVNHEELADVLAGGLRAMTKKPHLIDRDDKGRPIYDYVDEDDWGTRHRYLETALRLHGLKQGEEPRNINFISLSENQQNNYGI